MTEEKGKLNGEAKVLFDHLNLQREADKKEDRAWKLDHNDSSKDFRNEIKADIADIWKAMRDGFDKLTDAIINHPAPTPGVDIKTVIGLSAFLLTIITFIGVSLAGQNASLNIEMHRNSARVEEQSKFRHSEQNIQIVNLDTMLQREMKDKDNVIEARLAGLDMSLQREMRLLKEADEVTIANLQEEVLRIRTWKDYVEQTQGAKDAYQDAKLELLKEVMDEKAKDRFTGKEGHMQQKQTDRLEDRLSFLTKEVMEHKMVCNKEKGD